MKSKPLALFAVLATLSLLFVSLHAAPQKKKKAGNSPPTVKLEAAPVKDSNQRQQPAAAQSEPAAKDDPARAGWRIEVAPYAILGSGRPGKGAADFDKPDGLAFTPNGWLLATDAKNRRVQIWDVKNKAYLGEFGHGVFGGEIVDIAIADQCNYRLALYRWSDINRAMAPAAAKNNLVAKGVVGDSAGKGEKAGHKKGKKKR